MVGTKPARTVRAWCKNENPAAIACSGVCNSDFGSPYGFAAASGARDGSVASGRLTIAEIEDGALIEVETGAGAATATAGAGVEAI